MLYHLELSRSVSSTELRISYRDGRSKGGSPLNDVELLGTDWDPQHDRERGGKSTPWHEVYEVSASIAKMTSKLGDYAPERTVSPSSGSSPRLGSLGLATGVLCFVLSLLFYYGAVLRIDLRRTSLLDLGPYTDAVEYFAQAKSILKDGSPTIQIGYDKLPSRYPPGYPSLMIPWLRFLPHNGILAPFRTNQTIGLSLLIGSFAFYFAIGRPLAGGLAALLTGSQPAFITFSRSSMSDLSGATAAVLAFVLVYIGLRQMRRWPVYAAAIVAWFGSMHSATVTVLRSVIISSGPVSRSPFLAYMAYALLSHRCGIHYTTQFHTSFLILWNSAIH